MDIRVQAYHTTFNSSGRSFSAAGNLTSSQRSGEAMVNAVDATTPTRHVREGDENPRALRELGKPPSNTFATGRGKFVDIYV